MVQSQVVSTFIPATQASSQSTCSGGPSRTWLCCQGSPVSLRAHPESSQIIDQFMIISFKFKHSPTSKPFLKNRNFTHLKTKFIFNGHDYFHMVEAIEAKILWVIQMNLVFKSENYVHYNILLNFATLIKCESMLSWSAAILSKALQTAKTRLATSDWGEFMITIDLSGKLKTVKTSAAVEQALTVGRLRSLQAGWLWAAPAILTESKVDEYGCRNQQGRWMWLQKSSQFSSPICTGYLSSHPEPIGRVIHSVDQLDRDHTGS